MNNSIIDLNNHNYFDYLKNNDCLVVFHKPKCPNCKVLMKVMDKCKLQYPEINMAVINSVDNKEIVDHLEISRIPCILVYKKGELRNQKSGIMKPAELAHFYLEA